jgi:hypothetical protein
MTADEPGDASRHRGRLTVVVGHHDLLGDVHYAGGDRQLVAGAARRESQAVEALIDLVQRGDRSRRQSQPGGERGADLAAPRGQRLSLGGQEVGEAGRQLAGSLPSGPRGEAFVLARRPSWVLGMQRLQRSLDGHVVVEHLGERRGVRRAAERAQQGREVDRLAVIARQAEVVGEHRGDDAGAQALLEGNPGAQIRRQRQRAEDLSQAKRGLQLGAILTGEPIDVTRRNRPFGRCRSAGPGSSSPCSRPATR